MHTKCSALKKKKTTTLIVGFDFYCCFGMKCLSIAVNMFLCYNDSL